MTGSRVGPGLHLALLWHQHQPDYLERSPESETPPRRSEATERPSRAAASLYRHPWVRLHAIRDYYSMAAPVAEHPGVQLTINLTPSLLRQIDDYAEREAMDRALELTLRPPDRGRAGRDPRWFLRRRLAQPARDFLDAVAERFAATAGHPGVGPRRH